MKKQSLTVFSSAALCVVFSCRQAPEGFDASGVFEAVETIISAEANGRLKAFEIEEGQQLQAGQSIGYIDSMQLYLKKQQLLSQARAVLRKQPNIPIQLASLREQLKTAEREKQRTLNLLAGDAATAKQLDDIQAQIDVLQRQLAAQSSSLSISNDGLQHDAIPLQIQVQQLDDQLQKCRLVNPLTGTVLTKYAQAHELMSIGKPLYKIADLSSMVLKAYISATQLAQVRLNQKVKVFTDMDSKVETEGLLFWISDQAEFTPKTIQTKEERVNKVYAIKVRVQNTGRYKIGMYGELKFQ